jgi:hypothetical protein
MKGRPCLLAACWMQDAGCRCGLSCHHLLGKEGPVIYNYSLGFIDLCRPLFRLSSGMLPDENFICPRTLRTPAMWCLIGSILARALPLRHMPEGA